MFFWIDKKLSFFSEKQTKAHCRFVRKQEGGTIIEIKEDIQKMRFELKLVFFLFLIKMIIF